jgi:hypothetical protein
MAEAVYLLCALTSLGCAAALLKTYLLRRTHVVLWSCFCFGLLALSNVLLVVDLIVLPRVDLSLSRAAVGAAAIVSLLIGLIWEVE